MTPPSVAPRYVRTPTAGFLRSLDVDRPLARVDLAGSIAHAEMLERIGLLTAAERTALVQGLRAVAREIRDDRFPWRPELEDVHTNVEVRLGELIGPVAGKLHTGRSRNDQVALDERLYLRTAVAEVARPLLRLQEILRRRARAEAKTPLPGYTHLQRAQPITLGHHLLAHYFRVDRDLERLFATVARANVSPLGAGALAGSTLPLDPAYVAGRLGFDRAFENSLDAVSDRDPLVELLFDLALLSIHLSSLGEELVLWASSEFGFVRPTEALGGGSSLMPQKQNPDVPELVRGKAGRIVGHLVGLLTTLKGLPLAYDRDLQEDKAPVLDAVREVATTVAALAEVMDRLEFDPERMAAAADDPRLLATDQAERLVRAGVPFREAHESVGAHLAQGGDPRELPAAHRGLVGPGPLDGRSAAQHRRSPGGPGGVALEAQLQLADARYGARFESLSSIDRSNGRIDELLEERAE